MSELLQYGGGLLLRDGSLVESEAGGVCCHYPLISCFTGAVSAFTLTKAAVGGHAAEIFHRAADDVCYRLGSPVPCPGTDAGAGTWYAGCDTCADAVPCVWQSGYPTSITFTVTGTQGGCCFDAFANRIKTTGNLDGTYNVPLVNYPGVLQGFHGEANFPTAARGYLYSPPFDVACPNTAATLADSADQVRLEVNYQPPGENFLRLYLVGATLTLQGPVISALLCRKGPLDPLGETFDMPFNDVVACGPVLPNIWAFHSGTAVATYHW